MPTEHETRVQVTIDEQQSGVKVWSAGGGNDDVYNCNVKCSANRTAGEILQQIQEYFHTQTKRSLEAHGPAHCAWQMATATALHFQGEPITATLVEAGVQSGSQLTVVMKFQTDSASCFTDCMAPEGAWVNNFGVYQKGAEKAAESGAPVPQQMHKV